MDEYEKELCRTLHIAAAEARCLHRLRLIRASARACVAQRALLVPSPVPQAPTAPHPTSPPALRAPTSCGKTPGTNTEVHTHLAIKPRAKRAVRLRSRSSESSTRDRALLGSTRVSIPGMAVSKILRERVEGVAVGPVSQN